MTKKKKKMMNRIKSYLNVNEIKCKSILFWSGVLLILVFTYAFLCHVSIGHLGLPDYLQNVLVLEQDEVYENIHDSNVFKNLVTPYSNDGWIDFSLINDQKEYNYLTLYLSKLNRPNTKYEIYYKSNENEEFLSSNSLVKALVNGQNTIRISSKNATHFRLMLGDKPGASLEIKKIAFSKYPILPRLVIPLCLSFILCACITLYFVVYKDLYKWLSKRQVLLFAAIVMVQVAYLFYYAIQKNDFFEDEILSYVYSNGTYSTLIARNVPDIYNHWHPGKYFSNLLSVQPEASERFKFWTLNIKTFPFHNYQMFVVSSLFPGIFSKWIGISINIFWFIITQIMIYLTSKLFLKGKRALLPSILWGFISGTISLNMYVRMYTTLCFFFVTTIYLGCLILLKKRINVWFYIILAANIFLGMATHQYYLILLLFASLFILAYFIIRKKFARLWGCVLTVASTAIVFNALFPLAINNILNSSQGVEVWSNLDNFTNFFTLFKRHVHEYNLALFGNKFSFWIILILCLLVVLVMKHYITVAKARDNIWEIEILLVKPRKFLRYLTPTAESIINNIHVYFICFVSLAYALVLVKIAPNWYRPGRYIFSIYSLIIVLFCVLFDRILLQILKRNNLVQRLSMVLVVLVFLSFVFTNRSVEYLYKEIPNSPEVAELFDEASCIAIITPSIRRDWLEGGSMLANFSEFNSTIILDYDDSEFWNNLKTAIIEVNNDEKRELLLHISDSNENEDEILSFFEGYGYVNPKPIFIYKGIFYLISNEQNPAA